MIAVVSRYKGLYQELQKGFREASLNVGTLLFCPALFKQSETEFCIQAQYLYAASLRLRWERVSSLLVGAKKGGPGSAG